MDLQKPIDRVARSKRILVLGSSGSGKTTFSIRLGQILDIRPIHLDAHFWQPGWVSTPQPEWKAVVSSLVREESWIMDGMYESTLHLRLPAAEAVIMVECSRWTCLWRVIKRKAFTDDQNRPDAPPGQKIDRDFLRYVWQYPRVTRPFVLDCIREYGPDKTLIQLDGQRDLKQFERQLELFIDRQEGPV